MVEPAEASTEVGAEQDIGEGAGVFLWPLVVLVAVATAATLVAWL